jgi:tyrosyl-tRNA synthetase
VLQHIMGNEAAQFDGRKFGYLGIPSPYDTVCTFNDKSGITKMEDWINAKRPMKISAIGPGTSTSDIPKLLKAALNLPMDVIDGYKGGADARLAVESGEVDGYCGSWGTVETVWRSAYESKKIHAVLQASLEPHPKYKHIPVAINYAKSEEARELLTSGAVSVNGERVDAEARVTTNDLLYGHTILIRRGKKSWHATKWE